MKQLFLATCLYAAFRAGRGHDDTRRIVARPGGAGPVYRGVGRTCSRRTPCPACRARDLAARARARDRHRGRAGAIGRYLGLSSGWLGAAARHRAPRRLARRRNAGGYRYGHLRYRRLRWSRFWHASGRARSSGAAGVLDAAASRMGLAEPGVRERRFVHLVRRAGALDLRRRSDGVPRWPW